MSNPVDIIARSQQNAPLSPFERAFLKFLQGALIGLIIDGGNIILSYYTSTVPNTLPINWMHLLVIPLGTGFLAALMKWLSAQGDTVLPQADTPLPPATSSINAPSPDPHVQTASVISAEDTKGSI